MGVQLGNRELTGLSFEGGDSLLEDHRHFQEVIDDPAAPAQTERVILCSGKIYYDLLAERGYGQARGPAGGRAGRHVRVHVLGAEEVAEHAEQMTFGITHRDRADPVLHQEGDGPVEDRGVVAVEPHTVQRLGGVVGTGQPHEAVVLRDQIPMILTEH